VIDGRIDHTILSFIQSQWLFIRIPCSIKTQRDTSFEAPHRILTWMAFATMNAVSSADSKRSCKTLCQLNIIVQGHSSSHAFEQTSAREMCEYARLIFFKPVLITLWRSRTIREYVLSVLNPLLKVAMASWKAARSPTRTACQKMFIITMNNEKSTLHDVYLRDVKVRLQGSDHALIA
jgi:hypothetical protein